MFDWGLQHQPIVGAALIVGVGAYFVVAGAIVEWFARRLDR